MKIYSTILIVILVFSFSGCASILDAHSHDGYPYFGVRAVSYNMRSDWRRGNYAMLVFYTCDMPLEVAWGTMELGFLAAFSPIIAIEYGIRAMYE